MYQPIAYYDNLSFDAAFKRYVSTIHKYDLYEVSPTEHINPFYRAEFARTGDNTFSVLVEQWFEITKSDIQNIVNQVIISKIVNERFPDFKLSVKK